MIIPYYIEYLSGRLDVPVYAEVPETRPGAELPPAFVIVEKTGSTENNKIKTASVAFQSWAPSLLAAMELNDEVKAAVEASIADGKISRAACTNDYNWTDETTKRHRMQAIFEIVYY